MGARKESSRILSCKKKKERRRREDPFNIFLQSRVFLTELKHQHKAVDSGLGFSIAHIFSLMQARQVSVVHSNFESHNMRNLVEIVQAKKNPRITLKQTVSVS